MNLKTHLIYLLLASCVSVLAQPLQNVYQSSFFTFGEEIVPLEDGSFLVGGQNGLFMGYPSFAPFLMRVDHHGDILFQRELQDHWVSELGSVNDIVVNPVDTSIYVAVGVSGCDYGVPGAFYHLDLNGNTLWFQEIWQADALAVFSDGSVVVGGNYVYAVQRYAASGNLIWEKELDFWVSDLVTVEDTLYALGEDVVVKLDMAGEELGSWSMEEDMGQEIGYWASREAIIVRTETGLLMLDRDLNLLDQSGLELYGDFESMKFQGDRCYLSGRNLDNVRIILSLNQDLDYVNDFPVGTAYQIATNFAFSDSMIVVVGDETPDPYTGVANTGMWQRPYLHRGSSLFLETYDLEGNAATLKTDAAVDAVYLTQISNFEANGECFFPESEAYSFSLEEIKVKVSNEGTEVLNALNLNVYFEPCAFICPTASTYLRSFSNLNLQPGQSTELTFGSIDVFYIPLGNSAGVELCVWASMANNKLDANPENNESCEFFMVTDTEELGNDEAIALFPNPAKNELYVEGIPEVNAAQQVWVTNHLGQQMNVTVQNFNGQLRVDIEPLPQGTYLLTIQAEERHGKVYQIIIELMQSNFVIANTCAIGARG